MDIQDGRTLPFFPDPPGNFSSRDFSEAEFLRTQVAAIEAYVERFPSDEQDLRALAWIEANASQYRHEWQMRLTISGRHGQSSLGR